MNILEELLGLSLIESATESPDWESTWWDTVFRGLQEEVSAERFPDREFMTQAPQRTDSAH